MYIILVYDISEHRINKVNKFLKQYLYWRQNSVFEGELTESQFEEIKYQLKDLLKDNDRVIIYIFPSPKSFKRLELGKNNEISNII